MSGPERIRILHVLGGLNRGGVETWLLNVMRAIDHRRFEMHFVVHTVEAGAYDDEIRALGGRILPCPDPRALWRYGPALRRILREHGPYHVVHSHVHFFSGYVLRTARAAGVATRIAHSHTDVPAQETSGLARRFYLRVMHGLIQRHATAGFAASRTAAAALYGPRWAAEARWRVLYYGIDLRAFAGAVDRRRVRRALGLPESALVIGHVGRLVRQKNHDLLVRILGELARRDDRAHLLLVGEGPMRSEIEERAERAGLRARVVFTGGRSDVPELMRAAMDVFVFPSRWEGLGIALLEAQAAGLPCVLSDAVPEEADAAVGWTHRVPLAAPVEHWAKMVAAAACDGAGGRDVAARMAGGRFDLRTSVRTLEDAYRRLAGAAARPPATRPLRVTAR